MPLNRDASSREPSAAPWPDWKSADPAAVWPDYFRSHRPDPRRVQALILQLHSAGQYEHVISVIESALIEGQSQPWMYEVLALSMELAGRPAKEIERVVLSLTDFGAADFTSMMYSAAYLTRFDRRAAALRLYRQASLLAPERPEPYLLGLKHARHIRDAEAVGWAACGILVHAWTRDFDTLHREAENAALEAEQWLRQAGQHQQADALAAECAVARRRDLLVRLTWSGTGDLDLIVEEPPGTVCSFADRETAGGGVLTHDGYGPAPENCYEEYVCALAVPGDYRIRVRHAWGNIVGRRGTLTITRDAGGPAPQVETRTIVLDGADALVDVPLVAGRRTQLKTVATFNLQTHFDERRFAHRARVLRDPHLRRTALEEFEESRLQAAQRAGAVGYQPVIQVIPEGTQATAGVVVSPDRRYVRISALPLFTNVTDIFPFSFISGGGTDGAATPAAP